MADKVIYLSPPSNGRDRGGSVAGDIIGTIAVLGGLGVGGYFLYQYLVDNGYINPPTDCIVGQPDQCVDGYLQECVDGKWKPTTVPCGTSECTPGDEYCNLTTNTVWQCDGTGVWVDSHVPCGTPPPEIVTINFSSIYDVRYTGGAVVSCPGVSIVVRDGYLPTSPVVAQGETGSNGMVALTLPIKDLYAFFSKSGFHYEAYTTYHEDKALLSLSNLQPGQVANWDFAMIPIEPLGADQWPVMYGPDVPLDHRLQGDCTTRCDTYCCRCGDPYIQVRVLDNFGDPWANKPVSIRNINNVYSNPEGWFCFSTAPWNNVCDQQKLQCSVTGYTDAYGTVRLYMYPRANQDFWQDFEVSTGYRTWDNVLKERLYLSWLGFNRCGWCPTVCYENDTQFDNSLCGKEDDGSVNRCYTPG